MTYYSFKETFAFRAALLSSTGPAFRHAAGTGLGGEAREDEWEKAGASQ